MGKHIGKYIGTTHKICTKCEKVKPLSEFHRQKSGIKSACKECRNASEREYQNKIHNINYDDILSEQDGVCAICKKEERSGNQHCLKKGLARDHCHITGKFRGLLCQYCNTRLAVLEDKEYVEAAMKYLAKHSAE